MYANKKSSGKHLICDFKGINTIDFKSICHELCQLHQYEILGVVDHVFQPEGYSMIFLLSESHLSIHTFECVVFVT